MPRKRLTLIARTGIMLLLAVLVAGGMSGLFAFSHAPRAHAASAGTPTLSGINDCTQEETSGGYSALGTLSIATNGGWHVDCFSLSYPGTNATFVNLYNVTALETGLYDVYFTWTDCHGGLHQTYKPASTFIARGNGGGFGGCDTIADITYLKLTMEPIPPADCGVMVATQIPGDPYYVKCFDSSTNATYDNLNLYGVYAIWTATRGPNVPDNDVVGLTWTDCHGYTHDGSFSIDTFIAPGDSPNGFGGCDRMTDLTEIDVFG